MDVYVIRGDDPSVAVDWDGRGPLAVLRPSCEVMLECRVPDSGDRIPTDEETEKRADDAWEEAESEGRERGYLDALNEAADTVTDVLEEFKDRVPQDVLDEIQDKITGALAN